MDTDGHVVGIATERDFLRLPGSGGDREPPRWFELLTGRSKAPDLPKGCRERTVAEVMTCDPATVAEDTPLEDVVRLLEARDIKRLPVVRDGRLVGVISRADMLRALVKSLRAGADLSKRDEAVRANRRH